MCWTSFVCAAPRRTDIRRCWNQSSNCSHLPHFLSKMAVDVTMIPRRPKQQLSTLGAEPRSENLAPTAKDRS